MIVYPSIAQLPKTIGIALTTRHGGVSTAPYETNNLALHVGDDAAAVESNRQALIEQLDGVEQVQWLQQVHGTKLVHSSAELCQPGHSPNADGCLSTDAGVACAVLTADCLPVLLWDSRAECVAAVHAGWRGLSDGILRSSVEAMLSGVAAEDHTLSAYIGPAISQEYFEVGIEVLERFFETALNPEHMEAIASAFKPCISKPLKFYADLHQLARAELKALGVSCVYGGELCSYGDEERFYSYRRDCLQSKSDTGRMASLIWRKV